MFRPGLVQPCPVHRRLGAQGPTWASWSRQVQHRQHLPPSDPVPRGHPKLLEFPRHLGHQHHVLQGLQGGAGGEALPQQGLGSRGHHVHPSCRRGRGRGNARERPAREAIPTIPSTASRSSAPRLPFHSSRIFILPSSFIGPSGPGPPGSPGDRHSRARATRWSLCAPESFWRASASEVRAASTSSWVSHALPVAHLRQPQALPGQIQVLPGRSHRLGGAVQGQPRVHLRPHRILLLGHALPCLSEDRALLGHLAPGLPPVEEGDADVQRGRPVVVLRVGGGGWSRRRTGRTP